MSFDLSGFNTLVVVWAALAVAVFIYSLVGTDHVGRTRGDQAEVLYQAPKLFLAAFRPDQAKKQVHIWPLRQFLPADDP